MCVQHDCPMVETEYNISNSYCQKEIHLRCLQVETPEMDLRTSKKQKKFNKLTQSKRNS